jgi:hypothetical protein
MSGNATNDELSKLDDDEEEEGGESTVAMDAPAIPNGVPLPVSQPPPTTATKIEPPAPQAARAAVPLPSRSAGTARMPGPRPPPTRPTSAGGNPIRAPLPPSARLGAAQPVPPPARTRAPETSVTETSTADPKDATEDEDDANRDDGPTVTTTSPIGVDPAAMFEIDEPAMQAAAAAARPVDSRRSPLASTGYAGGPLPPKQEPPKPEKKQEKPEEDEAATVAVPKDVIDRVRANPKAVLQEEEAARKAAAAAAAKEIPRIGEDEEESTKAVPREALLRQQDAHVVVGHDAMGDDATLAVAPEANLAAMPLTRGSHEDVPGFPPPPLGFPGPGPAPGMAGAYPMGHRPMNAPTTMGLGAPPQHQQQPGSAPWQAAQPPSGGMPSHQYNQHNQHNQQGAMSSGVMPTANPQFPPNTQPVMGHPRTQGGVMTGPQQGQQQGWMQQPQPQAAQPTQVVARRPSRISGQVVLLIIVGAVCLAIFVTGIVLFATTKF